MLPNISSDVIEKQKVLQPGNCVAFGSAFKIPMICKLEMPDPMPYSTNCNVSGLWGEEPKMATQVEVTPVENNYVTEGVATNALEESMQADTIFNGDNTSNSGADAEFNPMSGMGEI